MDWIIIYAGFAPQSLMMTRTQFVTPENAAAITDVMVDATLTLFSPIPPPHATGVIALEDCATLSLLLRYNSRYFLTQPLTVLSGEKRRACANSSNGKCIGNLNS